MQSSLFNLSPTFGVLLLGALFAAVPLLWVALRANRSDSAGRLHSLTLVTLFLTFDLVLFGAFTRLTDSGLGCPDWPGCYGSTSPAGAHADIAAAQTAIPTGAVTHGKAWVEMVHRYLATGVGGLIIALTVLAWKRRKTNTDSQSPSPWWPTATMLWVGIQGAFGALTVTMKLFPAIVSLHLLGGYVLLALLVVQAVQWSNYFGTPTLVALPHAVRAWIGASLVLLVLQAASGAWVSTNYAVLACSDIPTCQGSWWPSMDFSQAFELWRPLGMTQDGPITFQALTAIHFSHRLIAVFTVINLTCLVSCLRSYSTIVRPVRTLTTLLLLQVTTGISNVVLGWPLLAAVMHTGGAGAMVAVLVWLMSGTQGQSRAQWTAALQRRMVD